MSALDALDDEIVACRRCPRLVEWRERIGREKRAAFADEDYWARPLPGFGDSDPRILLVGLAPAAHGANRTGRMFTGDRSGDFLFAALHRAGLANQPECVRPGDGLTLTGCRITAAVRCAPPQNKPTRQEREACAGYLQRELELCPNARVIVALGGIGWNATVDALGGLRPRPKFGHGSQAEVAERTLLGCYHPSQQNTFTGRLTPEMMDDVFRQARQVADA